MFDNLLVSNPEKRGRGAGVSSGMMSMTVHVAIIWAAVVATISTAEEAEDMADDTTMIFLQEEEEQIEEELPPELEIELPPEGFLTLMAPINIPTEIPPIDLTQTFDPRNFSGVGVEGGVFSGVVGAGPIDQTQTYLEAVVDERPERISGPQPRYPEMLRQAGVEGVVLLEFVIDTSGRVVEESVKILQATNRAFETPAKNVITRSLYRPGRVRGVPVPVLVQQQIGFSIQRDDE